MDTDGVDNWLEMTWENRVEESDIATRLKLCNGVGSKYRYPSSVQPTPPSPKLSMEQNEL
jgi:hypothetical protein